MMDKSKLEKAFVSKGFEATFFDSKIDAVNYLCSSINGQKVGFGGSMTIKEMNLYEKLSKNNTVYWHWITNDHETRVNELLSDVFILSANGVSETGEIINIDGSGNRVAASLYGPKKVIYLIGRNKLAPNMHMALDRARNIAAPRNAMRLSVDTPCAKAGGTKCFDCKSKNRICSGIVIIDRPMIGQKVEVIFIDEDLGY